MMLLNFMRMVGDLAFYYAFAGFFVSWAGTFSSLPGLLIPALFYCFSSGLRESKTKRMLILLPELLCLLIPQLTLADRIAVIPAICYTVYLAWTDNYELSLFRQKDVLNIFWKIYIVFFVFLSLLGGFQYLKSTSLFMAVVTVLSGIFLLRVLRHDPEAYSNPVFLLRNLIPLAAIAAVAWILQIPAVLNTLAGGLYAIYTATIVPLVQGLGYVLSSIVIPLLSLLEYVTQEEVEQEETTDTSDILADLEMGSVSDPLRLFLQVLKVIAIIALIAVVVIVLVVLFRKLAKRKGESSGGTENQQRSKVDPSASAANAQSASPYARDPISQIRRQYRRYLRLCLAQGLSLHKSDTSADISHGAEEYFTDPAPSEELRNLYLEARYHGTATKEDAGRAKELVNQLKQQTTK